MSMLRRIVSTSSLLALLVLPLAASCGGGGGGGGGGVLGPDTSPPTAHLDAPTHATPVLIGDDLQVTFRADDDRTASVKLVLDPDRDPNTTGDWIVLFTGTDQNGVSVQMSLATDGISSGVYALFLVVDDGTNPAAIDGGVFVVLYRGVAGVAPNRHNAYAVSERYVAFTRGENEDGGVVLNGDGLADDGVIALLDMTDGSLTQTTFTADVTGAPGNATARVLPLDMGNVVWIRREQDEGVDLNADGDATDSYVAWLSPPPAPTAHMFATPGASLVPEPRDTPTAALFQESAGHADLNGDGDTVDTVLGFPDFNAQTIHLLPDTPRSGTPVAETRGGLSAAYLVDEANQGTNNVGVDWNGDGDTIDTLLRVVTTLGNPVAWAGADPSIPQAPRTVDPTAAFALSGANWVGYVIDEAKSSAVPLNGDADNTDYVVALYDPNTQKEVIPGTGLNAGAGARYFFWAGARALYTVSEEGLVDRNGDGDTADLEVLHWSDAAPTPPVAAHVLAPGVGSLTGLALDGGSAAELAPGMFGLVLSEQTNGTDLNGDGDTGDKIFAIVNLLATPPVVTITGLEPAPAGAVAGSTIPETGVADDTGVVIQVLETANGDLNADGDTSDALLVRFDFGSPGTPVFLADTGGLHVAIGQGLVAVTARESLTAQDFNGDGDTNDVVFRVLTNDGTVVVPGLPSTQASVPATQDGRAFAYLRSESEEGRDLNHDGDMLDLVLAIWFTDLPGPLPPPPGP